MSLSNLLTILLSILQPHKKLHLITPTTLVLLKDPRHTTPLTGSDLKVTCAHPMLIMLRSAGPLMLKVTGESSSNTSPKNMVMAIITTPRPPVWRLVKPQTLLVVSLPHVTKANVPKNTFTIEWFPLILVIHTEVSLSIPTSSLLPAHAIFLNK